MENLTKVERPEGVGKIIPSQWKIVGIPEEIMMVSNSSELFPWHNINRSPGSSFVK